LSMFVNIIFSLFHNYIKGLPAVAVLQKSV
jgi:hypothetical protein